MNIANGFQIKPENVHSSNKDTRTGVVFFYLIISVYTEITVFKEIFK